MKSAHIVLSLLVVLPAFAQPAPLSYQKAAAEALRNKDYARCAAIFKAALTSQPKQAVTPAIGAARCNAGLGNTADAAHYLALALERGYRNCALLSSDPVFAQLRAGAGWNQVAGRCRANEERYYNSLNPEVFVAFQQDQSDRSRPIDDVDGVLKRDAEHREIVEWSIARHALKAADDYYHAAMVMQHGAKPADFALARQLAAHAVKLDPANMNAKWLYAAATDRYLQRTGKPQVYGTQYTKVDGRWTLEPFDPKGVTDAERLRHGVPTLAERREFIEKLNAGEAAPH